MAQMLPIGTWLDPTLRTQNLVFVGAYANTLWVVTCEFHVRNLSSTTVMLM